jgi:hypothetical protein
VIWPSASISARSATTGPAYFIQQRNNAGGAADVALNLKPRGFNASPMYADVLCSSKPSSGI